VYDPGFGGGKSKSRGSPTKISRSRVRRGKAATWEEELARKKGIERISLLPRSVPIELSSTKERTQKMNTGGPAPDGE